MLRKFALLFALLSALTLSGCSTSGGISVESDSPTVILKRGSVLDLEVKSSSGTSHIGITTQLRGQIAAHLLGSGMFSSLKTANSPADYSVKVDVFHVDEVSGTSRVLLGILAGTNKIVGSVRVSDVKSSQVIKRFSFRAESASHPMSGKSDISDAISKAAEEIVKGIES